MRDPIIWFEKAINSGKYKEDIITEIRACISEDGFNVDKFMYWLSEQIEKIQVMIDMGEIQKITISGFRGINTPPLEIDFHKENSIQSIMIYGRNGSGKSSIVDAWEWLYSGRIEHLAREGAGERIFPHKEAKDGQTWIEVEFTNREIGKIGKKGQVLK